MCSLDYPSFITFYNKSAATIMDKQFKRTVTNVGDGSATYNVKVTAPNNSVVRGSPERLVFSKKYEKQNYTLRIEYMSSEEQVRLIW